MAYVMSDDEGSRNRVNTLHGGDMSWGGRRFRKLW